MPPFIPKELVLAYLRKIPVIPPPSPRYLLELYARLRALLDRVPHKMLLSILKYTAYVVLLLNAGSLPFVWHIRVFWPMLMARLDGNLLRLKLIFASKKERRRALTAWAENLSPVGANPFEVSTVYTRWASIDDIDAIGIHLSNSSYAKALDTARVQFLVECFPAWGLSGGQVALGATHYHFIREIPAFAKYEVRLTIDTWDHKWLYMTARYVTRPTHRQRARTSPQSPGSPPTPTNAPFAQNGSAGVEQVVATLAQADLNQNGSVVHRPPIVEPDGAVLHCVAVSQICFKTGRITVPPAIILASEGLTKPSSDEVEVVEGVEGGDAKVNANVYSHTNPPPNWTKSRSIRVPPSGSEKAFQTFLRGGWRDVPEGERWWEAALGGSIERRRQANLEVLSVLKQGLERTRALH